MTLSLSRKTLPALLLPAVLALSGCAAERLYTVPIQDSATLSPQRISWRSVEVLDISMPGYAASGQMPTQQNDGSLKATRSVLWADDPVRSVTLELARLLRQITGAEVASEPWPFYDRAEVQVQVRVERMLAGADGTYRLAGQYFVAPLGNDGRQRSAIFDLSQPISDPDNPAAIATARSAVVVDLAQLIAREGLR